jgi:hypothetical protein
MDGDLRQLFRSHLPKVFHTSVESGGTGRGIPDSHCAYNDAAWWVEFKAAKHHKLSHPLSPAQIGWHLRYARTGNTSYIAIRRHNLKKYDELWLVPGKYADHVNDEYRSYHCGFFIGGPAKWDWNEILHIMWSGWSGE